MYNYIRHHFPHSVISQSSIPYIANDRKEVFRDVQIAQFDYLRRSASGKAVMSATPVHGEFVLKTISILRICAYSINLTEY